MTDNVLAEMKAFLDKFPLSQDQRRVAEITYGEICFVLAGQMARYPRSCRIALRCAVAAALNDLELDEARDCAGGDDPPEPRRAA